MIVSFGSFAVDSSYTRGRASLTHLADSGAQEEQNGQSDKLEYMEVQT